MTTIEPTADIHDICVFPGSGLICVGGEQPRMHMYFAPSLGPAPSWAAFLENLTVC